MAVSFVPNDSIDTWIILDQRSFKQRGVCYILTPHLLNNSWLQWLGLAKWRNWSDQMLGFAEVYMTSAHLAMLSSSIAKASKP